MMSGYTELLITHLLGPIWSPTLHDLIPLDPALPALGALTTAEIDATMAYAEPEKAMATREAYASDWCETSPLGAPPGAPQPLQAHVGTVAGYISSLAESGRKASTIAAAPPRSATTTRSPATNCRPRAVNQEGVKAVLRGIRRTIGAAKQGNAPATADVLTSMLALCPDTLIGKRDRALLALGFAGAFRRSELCALQVDDLVEVPDGLRILIRRSKTDQEGQGTEAAIPRGYRLRPVEAVQTWLSAAEISAGPVFRAVARGGKVSDAALVDASAARIVKLYARRVGLDAAAYSGPAQRVPDQRGGERGVGVQDD